MSVNIWDDERHILGGGWWTSHFIRGVVNVGGGERRTLGEIIPIKKVEFSMYFELSLGDFVAFSFSQIMQLKNTLGEAF